MAKKNIMLSFAKSSDRVKVCKDEIEKAIDSSRKNLAYRLDISITNVNFISDQIAVLTLNIPDDFESFSPGRHLRGISQYLLKNYPKYKELLVGTRLLSYKELPGNQKGEPMTFSEAYKKMREGYNITHEKFNGGHWAWENNTIMIHCWNGRVFDIRETEDVDFTFGFITEGSWSIKNTNE